MVDMNSRADRQPEELSRPCTSTDTKGSGTVVAPRNKLTLLS